MNRGKKQNKIVEELNWECSVCTYRNKPEAFKCSMCNVRKGTSTRKPKVNVQLATQRSMSLTKPSKSEVPTTSKSDRKVDVKEKGENNKDKSDKPIVRKKKKVKKCWKPFRLKNVDRNSAQAKEVTINNITVSITEYKPKVKHLPEPSSASEISNHSEVGTDTTNNSSIKKKKCL